MHDRIDTMPPIIVAASGAAAPEPYGMLPLMRPSGCLTTRARRYSPLIVT